MFGLSKEEKLLTAVKRNDLQTVQELVKMPDVLEKAMTTAIKSNHLSTVECLVNQSGADVSRQFWLHTAARYGRIRIARYLLNNGANPELRNALNLKPIDVSTGYRNHKTSEFLKKGYFAEKLLAAAQSGNLDKVKYWVEEKYVDMNVCGRNDVTPLYLAASHNHKDVVDYLCHADTVKSAIDFAISRGNVQALKLLIESSGVDIEKRENAKHPTLLHKAVKSGHVPVVQYLLEIGADVNAPLYWDWCLSIYSCRYGEKTRWPTARDIAYHRGNRKMVTAIDNFVRGIKRDTPENQNILSDADKTVVPVNKLKLSKDKGDEQNNRVLYLVQQLQNNNDNVKKMALIGELCQIMATFDYEKSKSVYDEIAPRVEKSVQEKLQSVVRQQRKDKQNA